MSAPITNIQLTSRDTVNFYADTEIVRNMSAVVPPTSTYIQRSGNDIIIFQPCSAMAVPINGEDGITTNTPFQFSAITVELIGAKTYTPLSPTEGADAYRERAIDVYNYLVNNIFKGCCDCGTPSEGGCSIQWQYNSGLGTGTWYYASGVLIFDFTSYLNQDWQDYLAQLPSGSQITLVSEVDPSIIVVFEISSYSAISGYASWSASIIDGATSYTESTVWCVSFQPALGGGGGSQTWQETLIVGPNLTQDNTSNAGNFDFTWTNFKTWLLQATSFLNDVVSAIRLRTTGASSTFLIRHDATTNPLQVDVNSSGGTTWNTLGPTQFIGDASNEVDLDTTGFGSRKNDLKLRSTDSSSSDTPDDRNVIGFYNNKNDGNGSRKWFELRHTDLSTIEVFGLFAYDPAGAGALDRWVICVAAGAFSNPYSNNTFIGMLSNSGSTAYPFPDKVNDLIGNGSLILLHDNIDIFNRTLLTVANTYANSPIIRFVPRVWVTGDPTELFGAVKHAYEFQQQFSAVNGDTAWQVGFKDAETDLLPALLRSLLVHYDGTVQLGAYPDTRDDGPTAKALYVDSVGKVKYGDISGGHTKVTVVGSQASTTSVLADVTGLLVPLLSGITYHFRVFCTFDSSSTAVGSLWTINGVAFSYLAYSSTWSLVATGNPYNNNGMSAYQLPAAPSGTSAATAGNTATIEGTITPSADGDLQVQFAREGAAGTTTFRTGIILLETM